MKLQKAGTGKTPGPKRLGKAGEATTPPKRHLGKAGTPRDDRKIVKLVNSSDGNYVDYDDGTRKDLTDAEWKTLLPIALGKNRGGMDAQTS